MDQKHEKFNLTNDESNVQRLCAFLCSVWKLSTVDAIMQYKPLGLIQIVFSNIPSVLLISAKFWLWTIFSTISSASMRVSLTHEGWFSTLSCFLLKHDDEKKQRWKILLRVLYILTVIKVTLCALAPIPGVPVEWQYRPWGSRGSLWTSSILLTLCRCVSVKGQTPRSATSCRGVPAVCEVRQAGGAGVLGAVACRTARPQGGARADRRTFWCVAKSKFIPISQKNFSALCTWNFALLAGVAGITGVSRLEDLSRTRLICFRVFKKSWKCK